MLVAGIDSSTQATKAVVRDAHTGTLSGTLAPPSGWDRGAPGSLMASAATVHKSGLLHGVAALAVAAQQHGTICLHDADEIVRPGQKPTESV